MRRCMPGMLPYEEVPNTKQAERELGIRTRITVDGVLFFFFQAEDGIRDDLVTGVQTCALPISDSFRPFASRVLPSPGPRIRYRKGPKAVRPSVEDFVDRDGCGSNTGCDPHPRKEIGRASCRERV